MKGLFSQRKGITSVRAEIQRESMDDALRNGLWNAYHAFVQSNAQDYEHFCRLWVEYFKHRIDEAYIHYDREHNFIKVIILTNVWYEVYDLIEAIIYCNPYTHLNQHFVQACNVVLSRELSAYRIVGKLVTEITSEQEIQSIDNAITASPNTVKNHLQRALELFSDRENPDYRNSIKESISAVESICKQLADDPKAELGMALKKIESDGKIKIHGAQKAAFERLYGWTSDGDGIRHALIAESTVDAEDARFMLVSCSAFVNYLIEKANKAGIKLS